MSSRVLYVTSHSATAYAVHAGRLIEEGEFIADENGLQAFSTYLQRHHEALFYLLGDVPEEDFQQENIPHVTGPDRAALIARKLAQIFRDSKLALAVSLGREAAGRRDERVLFAAFTNTQFIQPWLKALHSHEIRLAGVYSVALTGDALVRKLGLKDDRLLIISLHRTGIRQNYFENGRIRFSRLTPTVEADARRAAEACVAESGKILQYLEGLRLIPRDGPQLKVMVFAPHDHFGVFSEVCAGSPRLAFEVVDENVVAAKIGLQALPPGGGGGALFCFLLGKRAPREQYASALQRRMYRLWQMRQGILGAGAALFAAGVVFGGYQFYVAGDLHARTNDARRQTQADAQRYEEMRKTFPAIPTSTENLKATVQRFEQVERIGATPEPMLIDISDVLNAYPGIEIDRIDWAVVRSPTEVGATDDVRAVPAAPAAAPVAAASAQDRTRFQVAYLGGRITPTNRIDYRGVLDYLNQFAEALRKLPNTQVDLVKLPFDTRSGAKLSGVTSEQTLRSPAFGLRVSRKL